MVQKDIRLRPELIKATGTVPGLKASEKTTDTIVPGAIKTRHCALAGQSGNALAQSPGNNVLKY